MTRGRKIALGLVTAWPVVYFFLFVAYVVGQFLAQPDTKELGGFGVLLVLHIATMLVTLGLLVFYVAHVYRSPRVPDDKRVLWAVILFLGNMIAMPVYWFLYIWRDPPPHGVTGAGASSPA